MYKLFILLIMLSCVGCHARGPERVPAGYPNNDDIYFEDEHARPYVTIYEWEF